MLYLRIRLSAAEMTQMASFSSANTPTGSVMSGHSSMYSPSSVKIWMRLLVRSPT